MVDCCITEPLWRLDEGKLCGVSGLEMVEPWPSLLYGSPSLRFNRVHVTRAVLRWPPLQFVLSERHLVVVIPAG